MTNDLSLDTGRVVVARRVGNVDGTDLTRKNRRFRGWIYAVEVPD